MPASSHTWWPATYFDSRSSFIEQAVACGASVHSHESAVNGPEDQALTTEVATFISDKDTHRVILLSGVHGVEGFIGASVQRRAMQSLSSSSLPEGVGLVMIHAVNPWGFAHLRRVDENNIDVNRNLFDAAVAQPTSHPEYAALDPIINPKHPPCLSGEIRYWSQALKLILGHGGIKQLAAPIAAGQCDYPKGLFFSGNDNGASSRLLQQLLLRYTANAESVTVLDVHSGLGPSGTATLIGNTNRADKGEELPWLQTHYTQRILLDTDSTNAYSAQGSLSRWCATVLEHQQFVYLCVEIGTVNPLTLFSALRRENQAHHWSSDKDKRFASCKQDLLNAFSPPSPTWRRKATTEGLQVFSSTLSAAQRNWQ